MDYKGFTSEDFAKDSFFIRWVKGETEAAWFWTSFMKEHPEQRTAIEQARKIMTSIAIKNDELPKESFDSMRTQLIMNIRVQKESAKENKAIQKVKNSQKIWLAAAVFALLIISSILYNAAPLKQLEILKNQRASRIMEKRVNPKGQKSTLLLSDGTKIWLNADSKLTYAKNFGASATREVFLQGEAFFEVAHDATKPFIVHTSELDIRVLGTSFNVKSYNEDKKIETTLLEGQVKISKANESPDDASLILAPNQKAIFQKATKVMDVEQIQAERSSAWRQDKLVFDETTYGEVITQLERWYDVNITFEGEDDLQCKLTASIENETLEEVLNLLALSHKISYTISGNNIYIKGTLCQ